MGHGSTRRFGFFGGVGGVRWGRSGVNCFVVGFFLMETADLAANIFLSSQQIRIGDHRCCITGFCGQV